MKPTAAAPPLIQTQAAVTSASVDTTVYPTTATNSSKQVDVHPQGDQQTHELQNTTAEPIPENNLRETEPMDASCRPLKQTRSGRIIKPPERLKDYVTD